MDEKNDREREKDSEQSRVEYQLPVTVEGDDATGAPFTERTTAVNVTRGGAFIATGRPLAPGGLLAFHDADNYAERLCYVQVVWVRAEGDLPAGAGVKIVNSNARWIDYLVAHSLQALEDEQPSVE